MLVMRNLLQLLTTDVVRRLRSMISGIRGAVPEAGLIIKRLVCNNNRTRAEL